MANVPEREVVSLWQQRQMEEMKSEDGLPVKVIYPGRTGNGHGADFRDAVILLSHRVTAGDIEIHVRSSDWSSHGHHRDPAYDRVILHVVMWHDTGEITVLQNGQTVPIIALAKRLEGEPEHRADATLLPCVTGLPGRVPKDIGGVLDQAGETRFLGKASRYEIEMGEKDVGQALYEGIMEALGYTRNVASFRELARRLPLGILERAARAGSFASLQRLLLDSAGLIPRAPEDGGRQRQCWPESNAPDGNISPLGWDTSCVRPQNSPARRLAALAHLLRRYQKNGILRGLIAEVKEAPGSAGYAHLEKALTVTLPAHGGKGITLLGRERAATIVINVLLPFSHAWAKLSGQPELGQKAVDIYRVYPKLAANSVERHMRRQLGLDSQLVNSSRRQQGLLYFHKDWCIRGRCGECPLGQAQSRDYVHL